jgi:hypothetical protein
MGAGSVCFQQPGHNLEVRAGREEEGIKAHRGEPLNEKADTQAERARQLPSEYDNGQHALRQ